MFAFPRSARLLQAAEFTSVFRASEINLSAGPLRIRAIKNKLPRARLGLVVTKKGTPKANRRNRVKRIIRERFRLQAPQLPCVDIVVQVFGQIDDARLSQSLDQQFAKIAQTLSSQVDHRSDKYRGDTYREDTYREDTADDNADQTKLQS